MSKTFVALFAIIFLSWAVARGAAAPDGPRFDISFPARAHQGPITGRLYLMFSTKNDPEVRLQVGWIPSPPVFAVDVENLEAGHVVRIDSSVPGFPFKALSQIPAGDYYVQALLNVYTEFHRADGHVIWAHMDQWEGQRFNISPGNLYSKPQKIHIDGTVSSDIKATLGEVIPPAATPSDTDWVKHIKIQSKILTEFWGRPMYLGAVVLLPKGYATDTATRYPVIYEQGHFSAKDAPFNFTTDNAPESLEMQELHKNSGTESGYEFYRIWNSDEFPRMIAVTFQHPTPYNDASYAVNSANNGPYGDAIMTELIPYIEQHFRVVRAPYARVLTGGSTGGWEALALQLYHPDFFGGTWALYPDPLDFRRYDLVNIYEDNNSFAAPSLAGDEPPYPSQPERVMMRLPDGQPQATVREVSQLESVLGSRGRSATVLEPWEATWGPVGNDGYPKPLWDKSTGEIDHAVADYMREHGYDLRYYAETHWAPIGPKLRGKLYLYCGDMDNYFLNLGVYLFQQFLQNTKEPHYPGEFEYGRPMKGHGWQPLTNAELIRIMAKHISKSAPKDAQMAWMPQ